ncbi:hypothetical protein RMCBS344292_16904 [Rhizopus microsporus]|nr:hypothetical protein RMCBS344292_16904 [Rhizopus microsporus]
MLIVLTGLLIPLISYLAYKAGTKPDFLPISCVLFGYSCPHDIPVQGYYDEKYKSIYDLFLQNFKNGLEVGAGLSVYVDGQQVVDLYGGWKDPKTKIPYTNDTLQMVFSSTKFLNAIIVAQLVEQGLLSYEERIATYWPEFAQGDKENVTLMDLMHHKAGVAALDVPLSYDDVTNSTRFSNILATQPHNFGGKTVRTYHAVTQGWYLNEIIRRVDPKQRTLNDFAKDFKIKWNSEWYLKPAAEQDLELERISQLYEKPMFQELFELLLNPAQLKQSLINKFNKATMYNRVIRNTHIDQGSGLIGQELKHKMVESPGISGHTNANSIAAMLANKGRAIVEEEPNLFQNSSTFDYFTEQLGAEFDELISFPVYYLRGGYTEFPFIYFGISEEGYFGGGGGAGGSLVIYNSKYNIALAYAMNGYSTSGPLDGRTIPLVKALHEQVKKEKDS